MTPLDDPRPFAEVLDDWIDRHGGTVYAVSDGRILTATQAAVRAWLRGGKCAMEREVRALMTLADEGRRLPLITSPRAHVTGPDRHLDCQGALEDEFVALIDRAVAAGWTRPEVLAALIDLCDNRALADAEDVLLQAEIDQITGRSGH